MAETLYVTTAEHNEFVKRIDEGNNRRDTRISSLESAFKEINRLIVSVEKMAVSLESMATEQKKQGERLTAIEERPAKRWDTVISGVISGIVGILIGLLSSGILK
jgi:hypothetical protein